MKKDRAEVTRTENIERVQVLLDEGADINSFDKYGQTALMNAATCGDLNLVQVLAKHGAELNHTAKYRLTALMLEVINHHIVCYWMQEPILNKEAVKDISSVRR